MEKGRNKKTGARKGLSEGEEAQASPIQAKRIEKSYELPSSKCQASYKRCSRSSFAVKRRKLCCRRSPHAGTATAGAGFGSWARVQLSRKYLLKDDAGNVRVTFVSVHSICNRVQDRGGVWGDGSCK